MPKKKANLENEDIAEMETRQTEEIQEDPTMELPMEIPVQPIVFKRDDIRTIKRRIG